MVAPHDTGDLVRSLVRVPGSGSDRTAGSECLDLARASSLAASVPVPQSLPPALATPRVVQRPHASRNEKLGGQVGVAAGILQASGAASNSSEDRKRSLSQVSSSSGNANGETNSAPKRARLVYMTPQQVMSQANRVVPLSTPAGPVLFLASQPQTPNSPPITLSEASIAQLIQERNSLRQENLALQQRLSLFQQLFKDKKRLGSVVKRLGVNVVP